MPDASSVISALETSWPYALPVAAISALAVGWLLARATAPPSLAPRITRATPTEAFSQIYGELRIQGSARLLRAEVDRYLIARYRLTLDRLPWTQRGIRKSGMATDPRGVEYFRNLNRKLARYSRLSRFPLPFDMSPRGRERQAIKARDAQRLGESLLVQIESLGRVPSIGAGEGG